MKETGGYNTPSGWNAVASNRIVGKRMQRDLKVRFLVIGAGFAGLAIARRLAARFPDEAIALVDALEPAENSSARNSGFMINLPFAKIRANSSSDQNQWQTRLMSMGQQLLEQTVARHGIDCDWHTVGHYKVATTQYGVTQLQQLRQTLTANRIAYRSLSLSDIRQELGTSHYRDAIWLSQCSLVQPAGLLNGLIDSLPQNVERYFASPVSRISGSDPYVVQAGTSEIRAETVFLAVNALLPQFGHAKYRQLAMYTYAGLSRPLDGQYGQLLGNQQQWGVTPVEQLEATTRKTPDNRLLLRAGFSYKAELACDEVRRILQSKLQARYPDAPADMFEHTWGGAVSLTRNGQSVLGQFGRRLFGVSGCNASGILKMTALGTLLADMACGVGSSLLQETRIHCRPGYIPPEPFRTVAVNLNLQKLKRQLQPNYGN
ncbi:hypothetical protein CAP48_05920 [Advenella sp. S44]|uniref:NAD(P)/FAD-dependent oxidoreductase n=1 Tax=Advenella sp. S44 TaxID=1982755 RepID=UPI000C2A85D7|nr:FAD-binding oxidoreductase [Advenella sp. S44]PJX25578.1 hypothetical protein CAP48_05920 [Advenella sp. S44]